MIRQSLRAVRDIAGRVKRRLRSAVHQRKHPARHQRVIARLSAQPRPRAVLVVCYGNVCRSPYLAAALQRALPEDVLVRSAGFVGPDRAVPPQSTEVATRRGIDLSAHRSQLLTPELVHGSDLVIVMDVGQALAVQRQYGAAASRIVLAGDLDPVATDSRTIRDPWNQSVAVYEASFSRLDRVALVLARIATAARPR